ncbi:hypothetical protein QFC19_001041 [Naganishia cerealis]|uniref:Uncharacterized protein n=1 Tax=Naganishia cerealis TaxID=610337 RepID=A0ACC2WJ62_9TREE|nr:hypothetical protein QFC19_001041 [Naganishia cerealis]
MSPPQCPENTDVAGALLSATICAGIVLSYLPQLVRITRKSCIWNLLGLAQVTLQWLLFSLVFILYMVYFPAHLKYCRTLPLPATDENDALLASSRSSVRSVAPAGRGSTEREPLLGSADGDSIVKGRAGNGVEYGTTAEWKVAVILAFVVAIHLALLTVLAITLLAFLPTHPPHPLLHSYARFLGLSSAFLAITQYAPQLVHTYRTRLVGALSIETMIIQVPGSVLFVGSLVGRQGVEWSTWLTYAVTGGMQAALLVMCIVWKQRQVKLGIDDFGNPLPIGEEEEEEVLPGEQNEGEETDR